MIEFLIGLVAGSILGVFTIALFAVSAYDRGYSDGVVDAQEARARSEAARRSLIR